MSTTSDSSDDQPLRISKEDMYMFMALWMQESPWAITKKESKEKNLNVVGSVFVLPNDRVLSADCTRINDDHNTPIHGAIRPLSKHPDKVKDCQVYLTRKPCAHCVKMLVQARVSKVFYLPLPPEIEPKGKKKLQENKSVDALFQVSEVSKSFYIPNVSEEHIEQLDKKLKDEMIPYGFQRELIDNLKVEQKWNDEWLIGIKELDQLDENEKIQEVRKRIKKELEWDEYEEIKEQVEKKMNLAFKWFCLTTFAIGKKKIWKFNTEGKVWTDPKPTDQVATHLSRLAQMVSNRTDDPRTGVGCIITGGDGAEIVSIGWNGFPSKALYGNHPQGSAKDDRETTKKYPHVIYAAQNALLSRNQRNLDEKCVVYMNIIPGDDCMPLLYEVGVRNLVLPFFDDKPQDQHEKEKKCFYKLLEDEKIAVLKAPEVQSAKIQSTHSSNNETQ